MLRWDETQIIEQCNIVKIDSPALDKKSAMSVGYQSKWLVGNVWVKEDKYGYEGLAEEFATVVLNNIMYLDSVQYKSCMIYKDGDIKSRGCYSHSMFNKPNEIFITLHKLYEQMGLVFESEMEYKTLGERIVSTIEFVKYHYNIDISKYLASTLYVDRLILNEDRHPSNLGVIKNIDTNEYRIAPIFDNGLSFLARQNQWENMTMIEAINRLNYEPFGNSQTRLLPLVSNYILEINYDSLVKDVERYTNLIYEEELVNRVKQIFMYNLELTEGRIWKRW